MLNERFKNPYRMPDEDDSNEDEPLSNIIQPLNNEFVFTAESMNNLNHNLIILKNDKSKLLSSKGKISKFYKIS